MIYQRFEANPDLEYDFYLAAELGMTVAELRERMSNREYEEWNMYHARRAQQEELRRKVAESHG